MAGAEEGGPTRRGRAGAPGGGVLRLALVAAAFILPLGLVAAVLAARDAREVMALVAEAEAGLAETAALLSGEEPLAMAVGDGNVPCERIAGSVASLAAAEGLLERWALPLGLAERLPGGQRVRSGRRALSAATAAGTAGVAMCNSAKLVAEEMKPAAGGSVDLMRRVAYLGAVLSRSRADLLEAAEAAEQLEEAIALLEETPLPGRFGAPLARAKDRLPPLRAALQDAARAAPFVPALLGTEGPRTYLLLLQNSTELRATGGFVTAVGVLTVEKGQLVRQEFRNSFHWDAASVSRGRTPQPIGEYMRLWALHLRDVNWWPDFPTTARGAAGILQREQGIRVDGVFAADDMAMRLVLQSVGPVAVPSFGEVLTSDNAFGRIDYYTHVAPEAFQDNKRFIGVFFGDLFNVVQRQSLGQLPALGKTLERALNEKHLLLYLNDPGVQRLVEERGWGGRLVPTPDDYLLVIDTNVGYSKVYQDVEGPSVKLESSLPRHPGDPVSNVLELGYRNPLGVRAGLACEDFSPEGFNNCMKNYLRVYVPEGAVLQDASGLDGAALTYVEEGKQVFGGVFFLAPGETRSIRLRYAVPRQGGAPFKHRLVVQKQPGRDALPFDYTLSLARPTPVTLRGPDGLRRGLGHAHYAGELAADLALEIRLGGGQEDE